MSARKTIPEAELERLLGRVFSLPDEEGCEHTRALALMVAGELPATEQAELERHVAGCAECRESLKLFESSVSDLEGTWASRLVERARTIRLLWMLPPVAVAAGLLLLVVARIPSGVGDLQPKGGWELHVGVERAGRSFRLSEGAVLQEGDRLGFFYSSEVPGHLAIYGVDQGGGIVRLHPTGPEESRTAPAGQAVRVPDGAVLSEAHGCEWVVGFFGAKPMSEAEANRAIRAMYAARKECQLGAAPSAEVRVIGVRR